MTQGCSSVGRASASKSECRGFESCHPCHNALPKPSAACRRMRGLRTIGRVPRWWNGRHAVLRGQCSFGRVSSNLTLGTTTYCRRHGQVVRQGSAKASPPVRVRLAPPMSITALPPARAFPNRPRSATEHRRRGGLSATNRGAAGAMASAAVQHQRRPVDPADHQGGA